MELDNPKILVAFVNFFFSIVVSILFIPIPEVAHREAYRTKYPPG